MLFFTNLTIITDISYSCRMVFNPEYFMVHLQILQPLIALLSGTIGRIGILQVFNLIIRPNYDKIEI